MYLPMALEGTEPEERSLLLISSVSHRKYSSLTFIPRTFWQLEPALSKTKGELVGRIMALVETLSERQQKKMSVS